MSLYENENKEFVAVKLYVNDAGELVKQYKTFQNNGVTRINEEYPDGTRTETFERE